MKCLGKPFCHCYVLIRKSYVEAFFRAKPSQGDDAWIFVHTIWTHSLWGCKICHFRRVWLGSYPSLLRRRTIIIPLSKFEPLPSSPEKVVLDHDRDSTMISHNESLEMENPWAIEFCEAPTLESEVKDSINEHGSFILVIPQEPCSFNTSPESCMFCAPSTHEDCNYLKVLSFKTFRRPVVDAYVYHKYCKFCGCSMTLTLQLKLHDTSTIGGERGMTSPTIAARGCTHDWAYDHKQSNAGGDRPGLLFFFLFE